MEALISTFHIDWKLMLAQTLNFGLVFLAFYFLASKPLGKLIKERTEEITEGLLNSKKNIEILKETEIKRDEILAKAKIEADKIFKEGKKEATLKKIEMIEKAREEVAQMIESGKKTLEADKAKMIAEAKKEIITLVTKSTEKVLGTKVDNSFNDRALKELQNL